MFHTHRLLILLFVTFLSLLLPGCTADVETPESPLRAGVLYAITNDSNCRPSKVDDCEVGSLLLRQGDSLYYYSTLNRLLSVDHYTLKSDTLRIGQRSWDLTVGGTEKEPHLSEIDRERVYRMKPLALSPTDPVLDRRIDTAAVQLTINSSRMLIHPAIHCGSNRLSRRAVVEVSDFDSVRYTSFLGVYTPVLGNYHLLQLESYGLFHLLGNGDGSGVYRMVNLRGDIQAGTYDWEVDHFAPVGEDLRGSWTSDAVITYEQLAAGNSRQIVPKWGLAQGTDTDMVGDPLHELHPDSAYQFTLTINDNYSVDLVMNDQVIATFSSLYQSTAEDGLLHAQNDQCQLLSFQKARDGRQGFTTNFLLRFSLPDGWMDVYPVRLNFEPVAR